MDYETDDKQKESSKDDTLLSEIRDFMTEAQSYWNPIYEQGRLDKEFVTIDGAQWDYLAKRERDLDNLPSLSINLTRTYCRQQINTQRQNRPQIDPVPVDSFADIETAKTIKGLVKDTEIVSDAESAYDAAAENAVYGGMGFIRVTTDYVSDDSFDQEPRILAVHNSESVYIDPMSKELDGSDNTRALVMSWEDKDKIIKEYGDDAAQDFESLGEKSSAWYNATDKKVLIAEYFCLDQEEKELCLLGDGSTKWKIEVKAGENVVKTRKSLKKTVKWYKVSGSKVLDRTEFVGSIIPVVPVYGEVTWIGEDRHVFSLVHFAKDPQRLYNYWKSTEAHQLAEMSDAPYIAAADQIEGFEEEWENSKGLKVLHYNRVDNFGQPLSPPQRVGFPGSPTGVLNAAMGAQQSITDVLNMHAPAMGSAQNDQSGIALGRLQTQQETSNFHFADNLNKSIAQVGRILLPCYQAFYTDQRIKRIMGDDGKPQMVTLNEQADPNSLKKDQKLSKNGWLNDITVGRYDIRMQTGANYNTQRQETSQMLQDLVKADPSIMQVAGDLVLRSIDGIGIQEIADRVERTIPPNVKNDPDQQQQQLPPEVQQHLQQTDQQMQQLHGALQQAQAQLEQAQKAVDDKQAQQQIELHKAQLDSDTRIHIAQLNNQSKEDLNELTQMVKLLSAQLPPPPQLVQAVNQDLIDDSQPPNSTQYQDPHNAGFFTPEPNMEQLPEPQEPMPQDQQQQPNALDDSQIETNAPMTADLPQQQP